MSDTLVIAQQISDEGAGQAIVGELMLDTPNGETEWLAANEPNSVVDLGALNPVDVVRLRVGTEANRGEIVGALHGAVEVGRDQKPGSVR